MPKANSTEVRFNVRASINEKQLAKRAAKLLGVSESVFVRKSIQRLAADVEKAHQEGKKIALPV